MRLVPGSTTGGSASAFLFRLNAGSPRRPPRGHGHRGRRVHGAQEAPRNRPRHAQALSDERGIVDQHEISDAKMGELLDDMRVSAPNPTKPTVV